MTISTADVVRPLRADARRNHERIVAAAGAVFAAKGREAQMDDVARRAKVGVGTVYRHFPTKEALLEALATDRFDLITAWTREALSAPDPWDAFEQVIWRSAELHARDRALTECVADAKSKVVQEAHELRSTTEQLLEKTKAAGAMRSDATVDDVHRMMCGLSAVMGMPGDGWRRYLQLMLDGLKA